MADSSDALIARFLALHPKVIDLSLERIESLLDRLRRPQDRLPPVIHVAGTNGKGSTIAFMRAILEAAGQVVHVYTSPHLCRFHERIRLGQPGGGQFVDETILVEALRLCEAANEGDNITVFEMTTAAALLLFAETPADILLLEVGLGGRFDATNVIASPQASVVTPVSLDHSEYLGDTVSLIAREKAGIFKPGRPAVIAYQDAEATDVLVREAARVGAEPIIVGGQEFNIHEESGRLVYEDADRLLDLPAPRLAGRHQHINAATAIAALRAAGYTRLAPEAIERGLLQANWPGRLQRITRGRLPFLAPEGAEIWLDGGHNPDGGRALANAMAEREEKSPAPLMMIVAMLGTKNAEGFLKPFAGLAQEVIGIPMPSQMAARPAHEIVQIAESVGLEAYASTGFEAALGEIAGRDWDTPPRILICGSLYLAGEVLAANGTPPV